MFLAFVPSPHDVRALVRPAVPIVAMQVGLMLMNVIDTVFVGHVSARELAAAALGRPVHDRLVQLRPRAWCGRGPAGFASTWRS
jgi:Na+-driven multidrug efflux pump